MRLYNYLILLILLLTVFFALSICNAKSQSSEITRKTEIIIQANQAETLKLNSQLENYSQKIDSIEQYISFRFDELMFYDIEHSPTFHQKYEIYLSDKEYADKQIAAYQEEIKAIELRLENNEMLKDKLIADLHSQTSQDANKRLWLFQNVIINEGSFTGLTVLFILTIVFLIFELFSPFYLKLFHPKKDKNKLL